MIVYSSSTCPKCKILKLKLDKAGFEYQVNEDIEEMKSLGIKTLPMVKLSDGKLLDFSGALALARNVEASKNED